MDMIHDQHILKRMREIKKAFDPKNILNPGKLIPLDDYKL